MHLFIPLLLTACSGLALPQDRHPLAKRASPCGAAPAPATHLTAASLTSAILKISPNTTSCDPKAKYASQCATASDAAPHILNSFNKYNISTVNEEAALLSLMLYETAEFKYNINVSPGRAGQGSRNEMEADYIIKYAQSIPALKSKVSTLVGTATSADSLSNSTLNAVRDLVTSDPDLDFGSAAWFLSTQCKDSVKSALKTGGKPEWESYLSSCVGVKADAERTDYFTRATQALS